MNSKYPKLREALEAAGTATNELPIRDRGEIRALLREALYELNDIETGPENSREEVSPMGSSPQRDCIRC